MRTVLQSWGPGKFDAELFLDGKAFQPDGRSAATVIPPAFGLAGVNLHTYTGWGSIPYWNAFVAILEMHGQGNFFDPRLDDANRFPIAARNGFGHVKPWTTIESPRSWPTCSVTSSPSPPRVRRRGPCDVQAAHAARPSSRVRRSAPRATSRPSTRNPGGTCTRPRRSGSTTSRPAARRTASYRTTPLRGLASHAKRGFYHDGRFATLADVVNHYDQFFQLGLSDAQKADLVEFLKSL